MLVHSVLVQRVLASACMYMVVNMAYPDFILTAINERAALCFLLLYTYKLQNNYFSYFIAPTNGRCTQPGECICNDGYTGADCMQQVITTSSAASSITSSSNPSPTSTGTPPPPGSSESSLAAIAGGAAAGGIILIIAIVSCIIITSYCIIKSKRKGI